MSSKMQIVKICEECSADFIARKTVTRFCSISCNRKFYKAAARRTKTLSADISTVIKRKNLQLEQNNKEYLKVREVAETLGVSSRAVYNLINSGKLSATNLSTRTTRIFRKDLDEFLLAQKITMHLDTSSKEVWIREQTELHVNDCYSMPELISLFEKNRTALYTAFARAGVPKLKIGKEVFFEKNAAVTLLKKYNEPNVPSLEKERIKNKKLAEQGLKVSQCYSIDECVKMFGKDRSLLYGIFNRRLVPKIRDGHNVLLSKKAIDSLLKTFKKEGKL